MLFAAGTVHVLVAAAWFGAMAYSLAVVQPRAARFLADDRQLEGFAATLAAGARYGVLAVMATLLLSGAALVAAQADGQETGWWVLVGVKTALLAVALGLFANVSWRLWPARLFAAPEELPALRRRFRLAACALAGLVGVEVVLGVGLRYIQDAPVHADVEVVEDPAGVVAERLVAASGHVVLTGGSTPQRAYERAAELRHDWSGVTFWLSDERCVPPEHDLSNFRMVDKVLLDVVTSTKVHRIEGEKGPEEAAELYANELAAVFGDELPEVDLMLLGIGPDAHLCSLFPNAPALDEREKPVVGVEQAGMAPLVARVTLTLPVVDAAHELLFLVTGEDKAEALEKALGDPDPAAPASLVRNAGTTLVCDEAAVSRL